MTPAPDTGRTAEENPTAKKIRHEIAMAVLCGFDSLDQIRGLLSDAASEVEKLAEEAAQLRSRLLEAEKGAEAMREAAAQIALTDCRSDFAKQWDVYPEWDSYAIDIARAIRALPLAAKAAPLPGSDIGGKGA